MVSGTPVVRRHGQRREPDGRVVLAPTARLDLEAEVGFVVGAGSREPVGLDRMADHVFGVVLVDDWSARDAQAFEYVPRSLRLDDGATRTFLQDGDEVVLTATAPGPRGSTVALGEVHGTVLPARPAAAPR